MKTVLDRICAETRTLVARRKAERPWAEVERIARSADQPRGFAKALADHVARGRCGMICEIKKASPSAGLIRPLFDPEALAKAYAAGGAACLSVLTDVAYFQGNDQDLVAARRACALPVLRKDFMLDPYQIVEARMLGADCVLLIVAALDGALAAEMEALAFELGMDVLIEVHDAEELDRALKQLKSPLLGINNRNLRTLAVDLATTESLAARVPPGRLLVSESGLRSRADLDRMAQAGAKCFLVGESLMRQSDVQSALEELVPLAVRSAESEPF